MEHSTIPTSPFPPAVLGNLNVLSFYLVHRVGVFCMSKLTLLGFSVFLRASSACRFQQPAASLYFQGHLCWPKTHSDGFPFPPILAGCRLFLIPCTFVLCFAYHSSGKCSTMGPREGLVGMSCIKAPLFQEDGVIWVCVPCFPYPYVEDFLCGKERWVSVLETME